jgi:DHA1 family multidrug resistance protein-like MFS transporter
MPQQMSLGLDRQGRSTLIWMCVLITVNQLGFGAIIPVVSLYADEFGVSKTAIGLAVAVYGLARLLLNVPAGRIADLAGRRSTLALGGAITVIGSILCAIAPTYPLFLAARFVAGAGSAFVLTGGQIVLADIAPPSSRGRVMAIYQGVFLISVGLGSFPGGWLADTFNLAAPFWANAALALLVTTVAWLQMPETRPSRESRTTHSLDHPAGSFWADFRSLLGQRNLVLISLVSMIAAFSRTGGIFNVIPILGEQEMGLSPSQIGVGTGMTSVVGLILVYPSGAMVDRFGRKAVIVPSTILSAVGMIAFVVAQDFGGYLIASTFWATAGGIAGAAPGAYAADVAPEGMMASAMGVYRALSDIGYVIGPLAMGAISDVAGADASLLMTAGLIFAVGMLFAVRAEESIPSRKMQRVAATRIEDPSG